MRVKRIVYAFLGVGRDEGPGHERIRAGVGDSGVIKKKLQTRCSAGVIAVGLVTRG